MATKAELEAELVLLRAELAKRDAAVAPDRPEDVGATDASSPLSQTDETSEVALDTDIKEILADLEDIPQKQPLMFALGAFAVGYLIGRIK